MKRASDFTNLLDEAGMTQRGLGNLLGYSDRAVSFWATGRQKPPQVVIEYLKLYVGIMRLLNQHARSKGPSTKEGI